LYFCIKIYYMKYFPLLLILVSAMFISCEQPDDPAGSDYPFLTVDYRFSDSEVAVFSRKLSVAPDNSAVYYTGEPKTGFEHHIYKRPLAYEQELITMTSVDNISRGAYAMDVDLAGSVYYQQVNEAGQDSVLHVILRAQPDMSLGDPAPQQAFEFNGEEVGFAAFKGDEADFFSVSSDGAVFIIGWDLTGFHYLNFRDQQPIIFSLPDVVDAVLAPDGQKYVYSDGSDNIYLTSTLLDSPYLIGNGRYLSISINGKVAWVSQELLHVYDIESQKVTKYSPPKNVASASELMNATLSKDGRYIAFRFYDPADSDIVFCSIPQ